MQSLPEQIAAEVGITREQVERVIDLFALETHKDFYEQRSDPITAMFWNAGPMAFFHLLGVLQDQADNSQCEQFANEYLGRLGGIDWQQYSDQMKSWQTPEERWKAEGTPQVRIDIPNQRR